jgi:hypothetical protein
MSEAVSVLGSMSWFHAGTISPPSDLERA